MVRGLADGLSQVGQEARALDGPLSESEAVSACHEYDADILLEVNRFRPVDPPLPPKVRHIAWFQDIFPETLSADVVGRTTASDVVYALGDPDVLGLNLDLPCLVGSLVTGVDEATLRLSGERGANPVDFSLCGFIPPPVAWAQDMRLDILTLLDSLLARVPLFGKFNAAWLVRRILFRRHIPVEHVPYTLLTAFKQIVEAEYRPLHGDLDIYALSTAMRERAGLAERATRTTSGRGLGPQRARRDIWMFVGTAPDHKLAVENAISFFARDYPRLLDRVALVTGAIAVSKSIELYGPGWERHDAFRPYWRGVIDSADGLSSVYGRSRINLANNTHGIGLHSRTLECMAVGGFIFMHGSPHDTKPGGMLTSFEPGVHYGVYALENIGEEARRWLQDEPRRVAAGVRAAQVVREKHLWRHRAEQILRDLNS